MLNSAEHDMFPRINVKMPTIVGILIFMSRKNSILGLSEAENAEFLDFYAPPQKVGGIMLYPPNF